MYLSLASADEVYLFFHRIYVQAILMFSLWVCEESIDPYSTQNVLRSRQISNLTMAICSVFPCGGDLS